MNRRRMFAGSLGAPLAALIASVLLAGSVPFAKAQSAGYSTGLVFDSEETIAAQPRSPVYREWYPPKWDLSRYLPTPGDQGSQGSCVGWAVAYAMRSAHYAYDNDASPGNRRNIASPAALYNSVKVGDCSAGASVSGALGWLKSNGVPSLDEFPYDQNACHAGIAGIGAASLARFRIDDYGFVDVSVSGRVQSKIFRGYPVVVGMHVPRLMSGYRGGVMKVAGELERHEDGELTGHAVTIVGYDDERREYKLINSWGTAWGEDGYFRMSYELAGELIKYGYVIETSPENQRPRPAPDPVPRPDPVDPPAPVAGGEAVARAVLARHECAGLSAFDETGKSLRAFVGSEADRAPAATALADALPGYDATIDLAPWPQCEALLAFETPLAKPDGLSVSVEGLASGGEPPTIAKGETLVMRIRTPDFPSYVYATYLQSDDQGKHEAVHLIQSVDPLMQYPPSTEFVIGDGRDGGPLFTVQGPNFGREMIVLIASASPLYDEERPLIEIERDYLSAFKDRLQVQVNGKGERRVAAAVYPLVTTPGE